MKKCVTSAGAIALLLGAVLLSIPAGAAPVSLDFHDAPSAIATGEPVNAAGLQLPGQTGSWIEIGFSRGTGAEQSFAIPDGITFVFNLGGGQYFKAQTLGDTGGTDPLRHDWQRTDPPSSAWADWKLTGLDVGRRYNLILFGRGVSDASKQFSIDGHDAGNGTGSPVTLDADGDGNFLGVMARDGGAEGGVIQGVFADSDGGDSHWTGMQFEPGGPPLAPSTVVIVR